MGVRLPQRRVVHRPRGRRNTLRSRLCYVSILVGCSSIIGFSLVFLWQQRPNDAQMKFASVMHAIAPSGNNVGPAYGLVGNGKSRDYLSPLLIFTCKRNEYLSETLDLVYKSIGRHCRFGCPIIVSEDGQHPEIGQVILEYKSKFEELGIPLVHIHHEQQLRGSVTGAAAYKALARHYGWALSQVFNGKVHNEFPIPQRVIVLEEDIRVAVDFFSYMEATSKLLDSDPTLLAVSAFNDNGHQGKDSKRLLRSDFFPGLGWMMTKELWKTELEAKWPSGYWDDWLRDPAQRKGRQVIRPEVSRTYHFGRKGGASSDQFGIILQENKLNTEPVRWEDENLLYLEPSTYEKEYEALLMKSVHASSLQEALELCTNRNTRLSYQNYAEFQEFARVLGIMQDEKAMIPRTAYKGIVETRPYGENILFLYPSQ